MPSAILFRSRSFLLALALILAACAGAPVGPAPAEELDAQAEAAEAAPAPHAQEEPAPGQDKLPAQALTPQLLYQMLLAEIAGQRGDLQVSVQAYLDLARSTRDPRIAKRATEVAQYARQYEAALEAARLWLELDPDSLQARQSVVGLLAVLGRYGEIEPHLAQLLAQDAARVPEALLRLPRLFARSPDKTALSGLIRRLTEPYLAHPEAHFARAQAAHAAGEGQAALAGIEEALRLRPDWEPAVLLKAQVQADKSTAEAYATLRSYLERNPKSREVRLQYARMLTGDKRFEEARAEFQKLLDAFPGDGNVLFAVAALSYQLQDFDTAESSFKRLAEMEFGDQNTVRLYLGQIAENRKRYAEARQWYGAITPGDQYIPARIRLAHVIAREGKLDEARAELQQTAASTPRERLQLLLAEAQLLREAGQQREAYELLETSLAEQPDNPDLLYETALMAERIGRTEVLEKHLRRLIEIKPDHAHAYNALGYSLAERNERLDEAYRLIAKGLEYAPEDPFIMDSMGWVLYRRGELQKAADYLQRAMRIRSDPEIAAHLGEVLWKLGRQDDARRTWRDAQKAHPDSEVLGDVIKRFTP